MSSVNELGHLWNSIKWDKAQVTAVKTAFVLIKQLRSES